MLDVFDEGNHLFDYLEEVFVLIDQLVAIHFLAVLLLAGVAQELVYYGQLLLLDKGPFIWGLSLQLLDLD